MELRMYNPFDGEAATGTETEGDYILSNGKYLIFEFNQAGQQ